LRNQQLQRNANEQQYGEKDHAQSLWSKIRRQQIRVPSERNVHLEIDRKPARDKRCTPRRYFEPDEPFDKLRAGRDVMMNPRWLGDADYMHCAPGRKGNRMRQCGGEVWLWPQPDQPTKWLRVALMPMRRCSAAAQRATTAARR
jgi:hypothetical protein